MVWPCVCACVFAGDCLKVSDTWPLKQPRINGHNRSQWPYQLYIPLPQQQEQLLSQGHLWWSELGWFSVKCGSTSAVTVHTWEVRDIRLCRDFRQGPEENETWKMSQGYCDILHPERSWKGSNASWEVETTAVNMNRLQDVTRYTALILQHQRCPHEHAGKKSKCILQVRANAAKNQCIYFN